MAKYDVEFKVKVVSYYNKYGLTATMNKFNLKADETIYRWVRKSKTTGFMRKKNTKISSEKKFEILEYFWEYGYAETDMKYGIVAGTLHKWERKYHEYGIDGLSIDGRGRKSKIVQKPKDLNKNEDLLAENQRLRLELEYLKKLDALVQEREERKRKKK
ncbi:helix-turn-helix domain-containing protein [Mycoplasmatota bacterium]|nr:helix-turn-helix domain-containing protein [Mycoplasmatota bacterium]